MISPTSVVLTVAAMGVGFMAYEASLDYLVSKSGAATLPSKETRRRHAPSWVKACASIVGLAVFFALETILEGT